MSKALNSPTGRLLRSSRLFSIPPPLPKPALDALSSQGALRSSDTATLPYPTRQAIATPKSSRHRGDWGLKRPLPRQSTNSSTPYLRINAVDTTEHITDFDSAADHTQNLAKMQEMNIVMLQRGKSNYTASAYNTSDRLSVFESHLDNTATLENEQDAQRWKTKGPWLAGMSEGDFQQYLHKEVMRPGVKEKFLSYLRQAKGEQARANTRARVIRERGLDPDNEQDAQEIEKAGEIDDNALEIEVMSLRDNFEGLSSALSGSIQAYFDLPRFFAPGQSTKDLNSHQSLVQKYTSIETEAAPPATHPSAGLSYLRTKAWLSNHPHYGPQIQHAPVEARVVAPRSITKTSEDGGKAKLGLGGFVADDDIPKEFKGAAYDPLDHLHPEIEGGNKLWVNPTSAYVNESGRVRLSMLPATPDSVKIRSNTFDYDAFEARRQQLKGEMEDIPSKRGTRDTQDARSGDGSRGLHEGKAAQARREVEAGRMDQHKMVEQLFEQSTMENQGR